MESTIQDLYPGETCVRCIADNPEDATTHIDHFFDRARACFPSHD